MRSAKQTWGSSVPGVWQRLPYGPRPLEPGRQQARVRVASVSASRWVTIGLLVGAAMGWRVV